MIEEKGEELLTVQATYDVPYHWSAGQYVGKFLEELRDNGKIYVNICPKCGRGLMPPRPWCGRCHVRMGEWVQLSGKGTVLLYAVTQQSFYDSGTGGMTNVPSAGAIILMDGVSALLRHRLEETDPQKLRMGMRVEAVLKPKEQRTGNLNDIVYFRTIEDEGRKDG